LLDTGDDEEEITTKTVRSAIQCKHEPGTDSILDTEESRQITLPKDYNKLEIPKKPSWNSVFKYYKASSPDDFAQWSPEKVALWKKSYLEQDVEPLLIPIDVKVQKIRNIDEINEVVRLPQLENLNYFSILTNVR